MGLIDEIYTRHSFYGYRRITAALKRSGHDVNGKRVLRLMRNMGLEAIYPKRRTSVVLKENCVYPYLLDIGQKSMITARCTYKYVFREF